MLRLVGAAISGTPLGQRPTIFAISVSRATAGSAMPAVRPKASACCAMAPSKLAMFWCSLRSAMKVPLRMKPGGSVATGNSCPSSAWPSMNSPAASGAQLVFGSKGPADLARADRRRGSSVQHVLAGEDRIGDAVGEAERLLRRRHQHAAGAGGHEVPESCQRPPPARAVRPPPWPRAASAAAGRRDARSGRPASASSRRARAPACRRRIGAGRSARPRHGSPCRPSRLASRQTVSQLLRRAGLEVAEDGVARRHALDELVRHQPQRRGRQLQRVQARPR